MFLLRVYNAIKPVKTFCQVFKVEICEANTTVTWQVVIPLPNKKQTFNGLLFIFVFVLDSNLNNIIKNPLAEQGNALRTPSNCKAIWYNAAVFYRILATIKDSKNPYYEQSE